MSFRLDQLLNASTVRVSSTGKSFDGMGFFFAPGLALTSSQVVRQAEGESVQIYLQGEKHAIPAEVKYRFPEEVGLVILHVHSTQNMPCVYLDADIKPGDHGYMLGCTANSSKANRVMVACEGLMGGSIGVAHLAGRSTSLKLNGAPILNQRTGKVCGIMHSTDKKGTKGEAVPMGIVFSEFPALAILQKEYHCNDDRWITLLHPDLEALDSDWSHYDKGWMRREQSIRALLFLLKTASQWAIIGVRMRHIFPWQSVISLIKHTFQGTLGQEMHRQYQQVMRQLATGVDPHGNNQARLLHRLDAQSWVLTKLMEMLINPEQDYASTSRLFWMLEVLQEQRIYVQTLKRMPGNFYPNMEAFKKRWQLLEYDNKYIETNEVLTGLVNRNTDTNFALWYTLKFFLNEFVEDIAKNSRFNSHISERLFSLLAVNLRRALPAGESSVEDLLRDLDEEVRRHPDLKVLQKVQLLMHSVSGDLVQGGEFRAWKGSSTYHFSNKCKLYPVRAQSAEMSKIICYETEAEAQQKHKPCKNCMAAEKMLSRRISDWSEGAAAVAQLTEVTETKPTEATPTAASPTEANPTEISVVELPIAHPAIAHHEFAAAPIVAALPDVAEMPFMQPMATAAFGSQPPIAAVQRLVEQWDDDTVIQDNTEIVGADAIVAAELIVPEQFVAQSVLAAVAPVPEYAELAVDQLPAQAIEPQDAIQPQDDIAANDTETESAIVAVEVTPNWAQSETAETAIVTDALEAVEALAIAATETATTETATETTATATKSKAKAKGKTKMKSEADTVVAAQSETVDEIAAAVVTTEPLAEAVTPPSLEAAVETTIEATVEAALETTLEATVVAAEIPVEAAVESVGASSELTATEEMAAKQAEAFQEFDRMKMLAIFAEASRKGRKRKPKATSTNDEAVIEQPVAAVAEPVAEPEVAVTEVVELPKAKRNRSKTAAKQMSDEAVVSVPVSNTVRVADWAPPEVAVEVAETPAPEKKAKAKTTKTKAKTATT
jgi:hypothetical protein